MWKTGCVRPVFHRNRGQNRLIWTAIIEKQGHTDIVSTLTAINQWFPKETFQAVQHEKQHRSNVIKGEDTSQRKSKKYSSKK
jgi:hypothetical protein